MRTKRKNDRALRIFSLYSIPMSIVGLWPLADNTLFLKFRIYFCSIELIIVSVTTILSLIEGCGDANTIMDSILIVACSVIVGHKIYYLYSLRNRLGFVVNSALNDWTSSKDQKEVVIMKNYLNDVNRVTTIFYGSALPCTVLYVVIAFLSDNPRISTNSLNETITIKGYNFIFPGDCLAENYSIPWYYLILINQFLQMSIFCIINMCSDVMYIAIITHICGQIEILVGHMEQFGTKEDINENQRDFNIIIKRHQHLMCLTSILEDVYNRIIFIQMLIAVIFICSGGLSVLINIRDGNMVHLINDVGVVQFMLFQSYLYTYPADNLANTGEKMLRSIYNSQWYEMPTSLSKNVVFMMMRINLPPYLTVGKFFYLTRRSYMDVIKTGASYLSVLRILIQRL